MTPTRPPTPPGARPPARRLAAVAVLTALGLAALPTGVATGAPLAAPASDKIPDVLDAQLADGGKVTFWVEVTGEADLSAAADLDSKAEKGAYVRRTLIDQAADAQDGLRDYLSDRKAQFTPFWIANVVEVTGDRALADALARRGDVERLHPDTPPEAPPASAPSWTAPAARPAAPAAPAPTPTTPTGTAQTPAPTGAPGVTWSVRRIGADRVWDEFGTRGEGIVIANIDTGVQFDHPALLRSYRGYHSDGHVTHDYAYFDGSGECGGVPCDETGHGTHVTGIQVGASPDGAYRTGIAPGATWIAARADEQPQKLAAGQWMLAPTDAQGNNPRPDLAPDVINNSWRYLQPFYEDMLAAWRAAGIFATFGAGNDGGSRACETVAWPSAFADAYAVGNTDASDTVFSESSRGPTADGRTKPDISAPGTDILSTSWSGGYELMTGTSMAAPAVSAAVALLWSAAPELDGDVEATRRLLEATARPVAALDCGGTPEFNNIAGHGIIDVYAAVKAAPRDGLGTVRTVVRDKGGKPVPDATVVLTGPRIKALTTGTDGSVTLDRALPGTYDATVTVYGHRTATGRVTVTAGETATLDLVAPRVPSGTVSGVVRDHAGTPVAGAVVTAVGAPFASRTGADGRYRLTVPKGQVELVATPVDRCSLPTRPTVEVAARTTADVTLDPLTDAFGHRCTLTGEYREGTDPVALTGSLGDATEVPLPFGVSVYGTSFTSVWISADGTLAFGTPPKADWSDQLLNRSWREPLPHSDPYTALFPFRSLVVVDEQAAVLTAQTQDAFVVEWRDVEVLEPGPHPGDRMSVSATLHRDGRYTFAYRDVEGGPWESGQNAVIGLSDAVTWDAFVYANAERRNVVTDGLAVTITPPAAG